MLDDTDRPRSLNHIAYPTWDSAATYDFYTEVLRCPFVGAIQLDAVPSTGDPTPFLHTFFALADGGCIAFFEVDGLASPADDGMPRWLRHLALNVASLAELDEWRAHFQLHGIDSVGVVDHEGIWSSIYVFDPNGVRIELTVQHRPLADGDRAHGLEIVREWCESRGRALPAVTA